MWPERPDPERWATVAEALEDRYLTRPVFLDTAEVTALEADLNGTVDLLFSLPERLFDGDAHAFAAAVGLRPEQARLALRVPGQRPARIGRADLYHDGTGFRLLEFNLSSALGGLQTPELNRLLLEDEGLAAFAASEGLAFPDTVGELAAVIREAAEEALAETGRPEHAPRVALMDWHAGYAKTGPEIRATARLLEPHGIEAIPCHTGQVREQGGRVTVDGRPVDVVYRYFTLGELTADASSLATAEELLDTFARCGVPVLSPLRTSMHGNKRALSMLWDDRCVETYDTAERELVRRFLPWTRELRPGPAVIRGERHDLLDHCLRHRAELVLKPSHGLGGVGTVVGRSVSDEAWAAALAQAVGGRYVVQELVRPGPEFFPGQEGGDPEPWTLNWGAFLFGRRYAGAFLRGLPTDRADVISYDNKAYAGCVFDARSGEEAGRV
ncbi:hypothetical protein RGF97_15580 [Streptomyces roseicoloratus]|uniref:Uncharacterized protein n=1 Tax=Streptomyces roseicoloratus TaxID=2508722 RepID=A0ABY9RUW0_9ACTN|nr:hypothetical protein [Streptomyces roseicoloratus]WMX45982.1 hypothetical protein RGF97_15580 [Streptomyces roseicoloratus]